MHMPAEVAGLEIYYEIFLIKEIWLNSKIFTFKIFRIYGTNKRTWWYFKVNKFTQFSFYNYGNQQCDSFS